MGKVMEKHSGWAQPVVGKLGEPTTPKPQMSTSRSSQYRENAEATMLSDARAKRIGTSRRLRQAMKLQQSSAAATIGPNSGTPRHDANRR